METYNSDSMEYYNKFLTSRFNFADRNGGALVLSANSECLNRNYVLKADVDQYMIQPCHVENKYFTISLAEDIQIDTIII